MPKLINVIMSVCVVHVCAIVVCVIGPPGVHQCIIALSTGCFLQACSQDERLGGSGGMLP